MAIKKYSKRGARKSFQGKRKTQRGGLFGIGTKPKQKFVVQTSSTNPNQQSLSESDLKTVKTIKDSLEELMSNTEEVIEKGTKQDTVEYYVHITRKEYNEKKKNYNKSLLSENQKKENNIIENLLGRISILQLEESKKIATIYHLPENGSVISPKNIMIADLYLLKTNRDAFFKKYASLLRSLTDERQKDILAEQYEFLALSEKLQKMTDIARRKDIAIKTDKPEVQEVTKNIEEIDKIIKSKEKAKANNTFGFGNEIKKLTINVGDTPITVDAHNSWSEAEIIEEYNKYLQEKLNNPNNNNGSNNLLYKFNTMILSPNKQQLAQRMLTLKPTNNAELLRKIIASRYNNRINWQNNIETSNQVTQRRKQLNNIINKYKGNSSAILNNNERQILTKYSNKLNNNSTV